MTVILPSARAFRVLALSCLALLLGSALSAGTLVVDLATGPAVNVDLTAEGTLDWAVWGSQTVSLGPDVRKASGAVFGDLVDLSNGNPLELALRVGRFDHSFSWSDGSPVAAGSGVLSGLGHTDMIPGGGADPVGEVMQETKGRS